MDVLFKCSSCGNLSTVVAYAAVFLETLSFPRILIFCSQRCAGVPLFKALGGLTQNQRMNLRRVFVHALSDKGYVAESFLNADVFLQAFEGAQEYILEEGHEEDKIKYKTDVEDQELKGFARRIRCLLVSSMPDAEYAQKFKALGRVQGLLDSASSEPEKLE